MKFKSHGGYPLARLRHLGRPLLSSFFLLFSLFSIAQNANPVGGKVITGKVTDAANAPLAKATVTVKGRSEATATDDNGSFSIKASPRDVLIFTSVGYLTTEISVGTSGVVNVALKSSVGSMNDVVVIGYGTTTRQNITTAVAKVDPKTIPQAANNSVEELLFGRAPGLTAQQSSTQPGGGINLSIRGRGAPLIVVDGVIYPNNGLEPSNGTISGTDGVNRGGLAGLNPQDIESIEVLKDASASIYGVNAANGVILITTKKGKAGKMNITYNGSYSTVHNYPYLKPLTATQYETLYNQFTLDQYLGTHLMAPYGPNPVSGTPTPKFSAADIAAAGVGTNWLGQILQTGSIDNHVLNISGGTDRTTYYFSGGYFNQTGTVKNSGLTKYTGRANLSFKVTNFLTLNTNFTGNENSYLNSSTGGQTNGSGSQGFGIMQAALGYPGYLPVRDSTGTFSQFGLIPNPVSLLTVQDNTNYHSLAANVSADVRILPGMLTGHVLFGDNYEDAVRKFFVPSTVFYASQFLSRASINYNDRDNQTLEATIALKHKFGIVNVDAVAGTGNYKNTYSTFGSQGSGGQDAIGTTNLAGETGNIAITSQQTASTTRSYFARGSFDFWNKYLVSLSYRYDGYSLFFPQNKYASFPSASVGWKLNEESFLKNSTVVDLLKLRASIGVTGNTIGTAAYGGYSPDGNILFFSNGATDYSTISRYANDNPNLSWQKTINKNIGLDFGFFKDRLTGSFDVFRDDITHLLDATAPTAPLSYLSTQPANGGHQVREGYDIGINTQNVRAKDFSWTTSLNVSHFLYRWQDHFIYDVLAPYQKQKDPIDEIYYFKTNGLIQVGGKVPPYQPLSGGGTLPGSPIFVDRNGDGKLDSNDVFKKNADPKIAIGIGNEFHYKQFDLAIFFYGQFGGTSTNYNNAWSDPNNIASQTQSGTVGALNVYSSANPRGARPGVNYVESATGLLVGSDVNLTSTNFVRCRNLTLGYTLNTPMTSKFARSIRFFVDAQNLFVLTHYQGVDPEVNYTVNGVAVKGAYAPYPETRTFSFGINAAF